MIPCLGDVNVEYVEAKLVFDERKDGYVWLGEGRRGERRGKITRVILIFNLMSIFKKSLSESNCEIYTVINANTNWRNISKSSNWQLCSND